MDLWQIFNTVVECYIYKNKHLKISDNCLVDNILPLAIKSLAGTIVILAFIVKF